MNAPNLLLALGFLAMAGLWVGFWIYRQFQMERTIDEVIIFLRKIDWDEFGNIFDIGAECKALLFADHGYQVFRRDLRVRIHTAREYAWRIYNNARVVHQWATTELSDLGMELTERQKEQEQRIHRVLMLSVEMRALVILHLMKLTLWTALRADKWPVRYVPSIACLRKSQPGDLVEMYHSLREAAANLALRYGRNFHDEVLAAF